MKMLSHGRVDAVAGAIPSLIYNARSGEADQTGALGVPFVLTSRTIWLVCNAQFARSPLRFELARNVSKLRQSGAFESIRKKYSELPLPTESQ